jgi:hypothetical protein
MDGRYWSAVLLSQRVDSAVDSHVISDEGSSRKLGDRPKACTGLRF